MGRTAKETTPDELPLTFDGPDKDENLFIRSTGAQIIHDNEEMSTGARHLNQTDTQRTISVFKAVELKHC